LVVLSGTLASFGLPLEGIAVILGVDELMDMARTSTNVLGNCLATAVVARWEGEFNDAGNDVVEPVNPTLPHHHHAPIKAAEAEAE
jgi:proton glutamate symport protein